MNQPEIDRIAFALFLSKPPFHTELAVWSNVVSTMHIILDEMATNFNSERFLQLATYNTLENTE